jgi:hypothetical protein
MVQSINVAPDWGEANTTVVPLDDHPREKASDPACEHARLNDGIHNSEIFR